MNIRALIGCARQFARRFGAASAARFLAQWAFSSKRVRLNLNAATRDVWVRKSATDMIVAEQVFVRGDYRLHFPYEARTIVDAGANIGLATAYFKGCHPAARLIAIEPDESNFAMLERNTRSLRDTTCLRAGLWYEQRNLRIANPGASQVSFELTPVGDTEAGVPAVTPAELLERLGGWIDIFKIDIEGAEKELFTAGTETWLSRVGVLIVETHDRKTPGSAKAVLSAVNAFDYEMYHSGDNLIFKFVR